MTGRIWPITVSTALFFVILASGTTQAREEKSVFIERGRVISVTRDHAIVRIELNPTINQKYVESHFLKKIWEIRDGARTARFECTRVDQKENIALLTGILDKPVKMGARLGEFIALQTPKPPVDYEPAPSTLAGEVRHPIDGKIMRLIPSDYVIYGQGNHPSLDNFNPYYFHRGQKLIHKLDAFYMDVYEVTNREYLEFCKKTGHPLPDTWQRTGSFPEQTGDHPVTVATYKDAMAYATWSRKELPDEFQWELAARGGLSIYSDHFGPESLNRSPNVFPYGNDFDKSRCNTLEKWQRNPSTVSVYKMNDRSPYGIYGMCGNAPEWTSSYYNPYPGHRFHNADYTGKQLRVIRGGGFFLPERLARSNARWPAGFANENRDAIAGFRLIGSVKTLARSGR